MNKKIAFSGFIAGILAATGANAEVTGNSYTTKSYVDSGLNYVYNNSVRTSTFNTLNNTVTGANGLASQLSTLNNTVTGANGLASQLSTLSGTVNGNGGLASQIAALDTAINASGTGLASQIAALDTAVNASGTGLASQVAALNTAINASGTGLESRVSALEAAGAGTNPFAVSEQEGNTGNTYVVQNGELVEMDAADTWDPTVLGG